MVMDTTTVMDITGVGILDRCSPALSFQDSMGDTMEVTIKMLLPKAVGMQIV
jgi:hypothetical protein